REDGNVLEDGRIARHRLALRLTRVPMIVSSDVPGVPSSARDPCALPPAAAPGRAARRPAHRCASLPLRARRRRHPDGFDQRARACALPDRLEPVRAVRARTPRPARLRSTLALRVLGARGLLGTDSHAALVAAGDARLSRPAYGLVGL